MNSASEHVSKWFTNNIEQKQIETVKRGKKVIDRICIICGDKAIGFNYGILSCASCKAFFHRNGNEDLKAFKCLFNGDQCVIDYRISRKCYRCRLKRCLNMGMKKELLLSQEEIQRRKHVGIKRIPANFNIKSTPSMLEEDKLLVNTKQEDILLKSLALEETTLIEQIRSTFLSIFDNDQCTEFTDRVVSPDDASELICCLQFNNHVALRLIKFCRSIEYFE
ncbi:unnamed protein product, partial [Adineta ricciae]